MEATRKMRRMMRRRIEGGWGMDSLGFLNVYIYIGVLDSGERASAVYMRYISDRQLIPRGTRLASERIECRVHPLRLSSFKLISSRTTYQDQALSSLLHVVGREQLPTFSL
jgi:hypothetical protein